MDAELRRRDDKVVAESWAETARAIRAASAAKRAEHVRTPLDNSNGRNLPV
jgi:hypothetical protein